MGKMYCMISDAAKKVEVENHVLRYWEEELALPIQRNELGHRHYSEEDIARFKRIKQLKEEGIQLKAIRNILNKMDHEKQDEKQIEKPIEKPIEKYSEKQTGIAMIKKDLMSHIENDKTIRLQSLLKQMIWEAVSDSGKEITENIKESVLKELDYQFRIQEEREEKRESNRCLMEEEHYQKLDELLREKSKKEKRKKHSFF
ncbi:MAG: helix-turn-helix domain-containing protein [Lachnospiraceae bacterium]